MMTRTESTLLRDAARAMQGEGDPVLSLVADLLISHADEVDRYNSEGRRKFPSDPPQMTVDQKLLRIASAYYYRADA